MPPYISFFFKLSFHTLSVYMAVKRRMVGEGLLFLAAPSIKQNFAGGVGAGDLRFWTRSYSRPGVGTFTILPNTRKERERKTSIGWKRYGFAGEEKAGPYGKVFNTCFQGQKNQIKTSRDLIPFTFSYPGENHFFECRIKKKQKMHNPSRKKGRWREGLFLWLRRRSRRRSASATTAKSTTAVKITQKKLVTLILRWETKKDASTT